MDKFYLCKKCLEKNWMKLKHTENNHLRFQTIANHFCFFGVFFKKYLGLENNLFFSFFKKRITLILIQILIPF
jgi:hypothetical protein